MGPKLGIRPNSDPFDPVHAGLHTAAWLIGAWLANRLITRFLWDGMVSRAIRRQVPGVLKQISTVFIYICTGACIAAIVFGQSITAFLAAVGASGVVLGFALRNLLADLFTGLAVNFDDNYAIGDWLMVPSSAGNPETVGQVEEIGWRCTRLATEAGMTIIVPNSLLGLEKVVNISRPMKLTRYETEVTIDYSIPVERARRVLMAALRSVAHSTPGFSKDREPAVLINETDELGVEYLLRYWIEPWNPLSPTSSRDKVLTAVLKHLQTAGITPAYPKADVFHEPMPVRHFQGHTVADKVSLLARIPIFEKLEEDELRQVAEELNRRQLHAGQTLFRRNEEGDSLFILIEGLLDVRVDIDGNGLEETVNQLSPGEFLGEMALLTGEPRSATITAHTTVVVYELRRNTVMRLIEARPEISESMSRAIAERQLNLNEFKSRRGEADEQAKVESITRQIVLKMKRLFRNAQRPGVIPVAETAKSPAETPS